MKTKKEVHFYGNIELAGDILSVLDGMEDKTRHVLELNLNIEAENIVTPPHQVTSKGYDKVHNQIINELGIPSNLLPSYCIMTKN